MAENGTPQGSNNAGNVIGWIEKINSLIQKSGLHSILLTIMVLFLVIVVGYIAFNPESFMNRIEKIQNDAHTESVMKRIKAEPVIRESLANLRFDAGADRVYLLETHNGGSNLTNLPFIYVDLTYAEPRSTMDWLESEYRNVRLSRYSWATKIFEGAFWFGPIEAMMDDDPELYYRLKKEGVKYMGMLLMYGNNNPSGVLGVVYTDDSDIPSEARVRKLLLKYSSSISVLLNNEKE